MPLDRVPVGRWRDYEVKVVPLPLENPAAPQEYYWHLFFKGRKINGGISADPSRARERATQYRFDHNRQAWLKANVWDEETGHWESLGETIM